jgi:hypothetical protein
MGGKGAIHVTPTAATNYYTGNVQIKGDRIHIFCIINIKPGSNNWARIIGFAAENGSNDFDNNNKIGIIRNNGGNKYGPYRNGSDNGSTVPEGTTTMLETWVDGTMQYSSVNGGDPGSDARPSTSNFNINVFAIGRNPNGGDTPGFINAEIGEIRVYTSDVSLEQRQLIEGELAWKWGLQGSLPGSHPHKSVNPNPAAGTGTTGSGSGTGTSARTGAGWSL